MRLFQTNFLDRDGRSRFMVPAVDCLPFAGGREMGRGNHGSQASDYASFS